VQRHGVALPVPADLRAAIRDLAASQLELERLQGDLERARARGDGKEARELRRDIHIVRTQAMGLQNALDVLVPPKAPLTAAEQFARSYGE